MTGQPGEAHACRLDVVADQLVVVAGQLPDALGDRPLGAFTQFVVAGLLDAMAETTAAVTAAVSAADALSAALRRGDADLGGRFAVVPPRAGLIDTVRVAGTGDGHPPGLPLSGMDVAGLGWLTPFVSFLAEPLNQLRGNPVPVTEAALEFERAAADVAAAAATYRGATADAHTGFADALTALAASSGVIASALAGAAAAAARVVGAVTWLVAEAVAAIVPVMAEAVAQASATLGQSVAEAIPRCVAIAATAGGRAADRLTALLASGQDLLDAADAATAVTRTARQMFEEIGNRNPAVGERA
ncbi:hypothetical protein [Actinophytocola sp. KF-1]